MDPNGKSEKSHIGKWLALHLQIITEPMTVTFPMTVQLSTVDGALTFTVAAPEILPMEALILELPAETPVTVPELTVATDGVALVQVGELHGLVDESENVAVHAIANVDPTLTLPGLGVTAIDTSVGELAACSNAPMVGAVRLRVFPA